VRWAAVREPRSRKIVSVCAHSQPITGQCFTSSLLTKAAGVKALMAKTSSHEMWLQTTSPCAGSAVLPEPTFSRMPSVSSSCRDQRRFSARRNRASIHG